MVSASNKTSLKKIKKIYESTSIKEIYLAPSIKVAEAAKITENVQRDLNLSLVNELSLIFSKMNITNTKKIQLYKEMLRIRLIEEAIANEYSKQEIRCPVHLSI